MIIYLCEDRAEHILSAVYDAWADPHPNREIGIRLGGLSQFSFTDSFVEAENSYEKAMKVLNSVKRKLGVTAEQEVLGILSADADDKADTLFRFLQYAFSVKNKGRDVSFDMTVPSVMRAFELNRKARNEAHLMLGFTRFEKLANGVYFAKIGPVNDVLPLIADHFAERFNTQPFIIYDEKRRRSVVYQPGLNWYFVEGRVAMPGTGLTPSDDYERLWKIFFDTIAIKERMNPLCQRTHCPLHFRAYMTEFTE